MAKMKVYSTSPWTVEQVSSFFLNDNGTNSIGDYDWVKFNPVSGEGLSEEVNITVEPNTGNGRKATFRFNNSDGQKQKFEVAQGAKEPVLKVSFAEFHGDDIEMHQAGGIFLLDIISNECWERAMTGADDRWASLAKTAPSISLGRERLALTIQPLNGKATRTATITITTTSGLRWIGTVTQSDQVPALNLTPNQLNIEYNGKQL